MTESLTTDRDQPNPEPRSDERVINKMLADNPLIRRLIKSRTVPYVFLGLLTLFVVFLHTRAYTVVGPIDELQHIDYADRLAHGDIPVFPEPLGQAAMREEACRGLDAGGYVFSPPPCDLTSFDNEDFQEGGLSTQAFHPPLYYAVVGPAARLMAALTPFNSLVGWERLLGGAFFAAGLCLALAAAVRLGAPRWTAAIVLGVIAVTPQLIFAHATVDNDVSALLIGALALWAVTRDDGRRWASALFIVIGLAAALTKITNGLGLAVAGLFAAFAPWALATWQKRDSLFDEWRSRLRPAFLMWGAYGIGTLAWQLYFTSTRLAAPRDLPIFNRYRPPSIYPGTILEHVSTYADPFFEGIRPATMSSPGYIPPTFVNGTYEAITFLVSLFFVAAVYGSWMVYGKRRSTATVLGASTSLTLLIAGPAQFLAVFLASSAGYSNTRYSWSMVPAMGVVAALTVKGYRRLIPAALLVASFLVFSITAGRAWL